MPKNFLSPIEDILEDAKNGDVQVRAGHTEAAVEMARLAGLKEKFGRIK